ncbi:MAG TPA: lytic transglycosylase domain-containing protein [Thermoanaerobaculia bacterium]|nr:lytic transglycosylase domain-containing protein [Thermoanaerobaculia bacterium]
MPYTRGVLVGLAMVAWTASASAQVKFIIKPDGTKAIFNISSGRGRQSELVWLAKQRDRISGYEELIQRYALQWRVDPLLVKAIIQVESDFNPRCVSNKGARGLMQLMPETARRFNVAQMHDPEENIRGGVAYLSVLLKMFPDDLPRTVAAYNAGENAVLRYKGIPPYQETQNYVNRALTVYYGRPYGGVSVGRSIIAGLGTRKLKGGFKSATTTITSSNGTVSVGGGSGFHNVASR